MKKVLLLIASLLLISCSSAEKHDDPKAYSIAIGSNVNKLYVSDKLNGDWSTHITVQDETQLAECTYSYLPKDEILDNEDTDYRYGITVMDDLQTYMLYFKQTFYVANKGSNSIGYNMKIQFVNSNDNLNTLRVMVFENDVDQSSEQISHNKTVYAQESMETHYDKDGNETKREFIAERAKDRQEDYMHPLAESFEDDSVVTSYVRNDFKQGQIRRYTVVVWIEGYDPDSTAHAFAPTADCMHLGISIS